MQGEFEMSMMGELTFFLGLQVKQTKDDIFINQAKYVKDLLKRFGLEASKPYSTPMSTSTKFDKDEGGKCVDSKLYRSMIGSLFYLTASRPDIMLASACVLDINHVQKNHICLLLREYLDTLRIHLV